MPNFVQNGQSVWIFVENQHINTHSLCIIWHYCDVIADLAAATSEMTAIEDRMRQLGLQIDGFQGEEGGKGEGEGEGQRESRRKSISVPKKERAL